MSIPLNINGQDYFYPQAGDLNWGPDATDWAVAVTNGMLQKAGGLFILLGEVDFGATYGLKSAYYKSRTVNIAAAGQLRLARPDTISWRNQANDGDLALSVNSSDQLLFNGNPIGTVTTVSDTNSIDLSIAGTDLTADLNLSSDPADSGYVLADLSIETDGLKGQIELQTIVDAIPVADTNTTGLLSDTDWNTFNSKQSAITPGSISTSTTGVTVGSGSNSTVGPNVTVNVQTASGSQPGLLSAADWTTFNNKQASGNYITSLTGNITASGPGAAAATIAAGVIVNSMVSASAAIAYSKLALSNSIVNADINSSAAIALSKLATVTASRALESSAGGLIQASSVTSTELGYVSGVTSGIQSQLNGKQATGNYVTSLTGDVTGSGPGATATTIANAAVSLAKMANLAANSIIGNNTGSPATPIALTTTQATAMLNAMVGDSGSGGTKGLVPAPASGDAAAGKYLKADGTWATVPAGFTNPMTDVGDLILGGSGGSATRLGIGANTYVLTSNGTTASWQAPGGGGGGANTALSNLASVAINTDLLFGPAVSGVIGTADATIDISESFDILTGNAIVDWDSGSLNLSTGNTTGVGSSGNLNLETGEVTNGDSGGIYIVPGIATNGNGGEIYLYSGESSSGNSGNITIETGAAGGTRGKIKLANGSEGTAGHVWTSTDTLGNGSWQAASGGGITSLTGDVTASGTGSVAATIASGVITNSMINASAAIAFSKLASLSSGNILVGNGSNVATSVAVTGDVTISNAGVTAIGSGVIVNADVNASAAIAYSKLNLATSIVNGDISASAAIAVSKLNGTATNGYVLTSNGTTASWQAPSGGGGGGPVNEIIANGNTGNVTASGSDTYITGSDLAIGGRLKAGTILRWRMGITKSAAGTATPSINVRFGTAGTTADTARLTWTGVAQTGATDTAWLEITCVIRAVGASGEVSGTATLNHFNTTTGFANKAQGQIFSSTSSTFDTTSGSLIAGISINPGTSGVWTFQAVAAEALNITNEAYDAPMSDVYSLKEDFTTLAATVTSTGIYPGATNPFYLTISGSGAQCSVNTLPTAPAAGVTVLESGTTSSGSVQLNGGVALIGNGGEIEYISRIYIPTLSTGTQEYILQVGMGPVAYWSTPGSGMWFEYDRTSSVNWILKCSDFSTATSTTSSIAVAAGSWVTLKMVLTSGSSITFYVNGVSAGTLSSQIPTINNMFPSVQLWKTVGSTSRTVEVDYIQTIKRFDPVR